LNRRPKLATKFEYENRTVSTADRAQWFDF
jgi:hypothetical protein